jgi:hypothetical protein
MGAPPVTVIKDEKIAAEGDKVEKEVDKRVAPHQAVMI